MDPTPSTRSPSNPLHRSAEPGNLTKVKKLLKKTRHPDALSNGRTALQYAVNGRHFEVTKTLLLAGANPNIPTTSNGLAPIHRAASNGDLEMVGLLIQYGANPRSKGHEPNPGFSPSDGARIAGHEDIARYLDSWRPRPPSQ